LGEAFGYEGRSRLWQEKTEAAARNSRRDMPGGRDRNNAAGLICGEDRNNRENRKNAGGGRAGDGRKESAGGSDL